VSLSNLSVAFERMRNERDDARVMHRILSDHCNGRLMDYVTAALIEGNKGAEEFLRVEAELHREALAQRRANGKAEA